MLLGLHLAITLISYKPKGVQNTQCQNQTKSRLLIAQKILTLARCLL